MKNPNSIVSRIIKFDPPLDRSPQDMLRSEAGLYVLLDNERRVRLGPNDPRSPGFINILEGLSKQSMPVYLEIDPGTSGITRLLVPFVTRITSITQIDIGVLGVEIEYSHGRHVLRKSYSDDFDELKKQIEEAIKSERPVILTEDDAHNIIDITFFTPGPDEPPLPRFPGPKFPPMVWWWLLLHWIWHWHIWPWWWFRCISLTKAQQVFDAMKATTCDPLTVPVPCIPFLYPDDGCWGRAHEMCRLMINMGRSPRKVWIQGWLYVSTKNNPNCGVHWGWHVAPTLCVRKRWFHTQEMVIDPSLFNTPVTKATWKGIQGDPAATLTDSAASQFQLGGATDPTYSQTNIVLATYRLKLQTRALQFGPPPYANCP
jgi:Glutaminase